MKPPPTDPPSRKTSAGDSEPPERASAGQVPERKAPRPGGHQSYRLGEVTQITPAAVPQTAPASKYDDGVAHRHHEPGEIDPLHNEDVAHEHIDVNIGGLVASAVVLLVVTLASQLAMFGLFRWFETSAQARDSEVSPLARPATSMPARTESPFFSQGVGGPQLLTNEPVALEKQRSEEVKRLQGYGWVNQGRGVAHVPIDEAKKLMLQRGVPVREGEPAPPTLGTRLPARGEASGGRTITVTLPEPEAGTAPAAAPDHGTHGEPAKPPATKPPGSGGH